MKQHHSQDCIEVLMEKARKGEVSRRSFMQAMGVLAAMPLAMRSGISWAADKPLVLVNWGGDAIEAYRKAFVESFTKATGIAVKIDGSGPTEGAIRTQVASGKPSWDIVDAEPFSSETLGRQGVLQPLDYSLIDKNKVGAGMAHTYGIAGYQYSYVIAWDSQKFGNDGPKNWVDFWDVSRFPGKRTLYKYMNGVLEAALLADGVAVDKLYPLDVDRALKKLDELKPHILGYWGSGAESQQMMIEGEASVGAIWHTRANILQQDSDNRVQWTFDQGFVEPSSWSVLSNNPGGKDAMKFIDHTLDPHCQVALLTLMGNGTTNPAAQPLIPANLRHLDAGSPENVARQIRLDIEWYVDNYTGVLDKYLARIGG